LGNPVNAGIVEREFRLLTLFRGYTGAVKTVVRTGMYPRTP